MRWHRSKGWTPHTFLTAGSDDTGQTEPVRCAWPQSDLSLPTRAKFDDGFVYGFEQLNRATCFFSAAGQRKLTYPTKPLRSQLWAFLGQISLIWRSELNNLSNNEACASWTPHLPAWKTGLMQEPAPVKWSVCVSAHESSSAGEHR